MKQSISGPTAAIAAAIAVVVIGFAMWKVFLSGPPIDNKPTGPSASGMGRPANFDQMSTEEKKKLYGMDRR